MSVNEEPIAMAVRRAGKDALERNRTSTPLLQPASAGERPGVKSAVRVLTILEHFAATRESATLAELSTALELPKSSCLALVETLRHSGYLYWLGKRNGYYPTQRWRDLGDVIARNDPILVLAEPRLKAIRDACGETAILAKRDGLQVLYLAVAEPDHVLRFAAHAGQRKPMHSAASGRALIGLMDPSDRVTFIGSLERHRYSDRTTIDPDQIAAAVEHGNARGWHVAVGEYQADTTSIAAAFRFGTEEYAFLIGAPIPRVANRHADIGALLARHARAMAKASA
jgi:IclR family acetate operon transcriptional repressor